MKGKIYVVGFGSGDRRVMTEQAVSAIENADIVIGYITYIDILKPLFPNQNYIPSSMRRETERCKIAAEEALKGQRVALVSSGDSGIYGMSGIMLEVADRMNADIEIEAVPGVTAASAAAALLGAPLMNDFAVISLSDLMTPIDLIYKRIELAALADFVICLYNPKSKLRTEHIGKAAELIMKSRPKSTPVGIVRNAGRCDCAVWTTTLEKLGDEPIDMLCTVIIGNSESYIKNGKMITPRGYLIK